MSGKGVRSISPCQRRRCEWEIGWQLVFNQDVRPAGEIRCESTVDDKE